MICSLLLLYARDAELIKNDLLHELEGVPSYCVCIDDPNFSQHHALRNPTKSRLQIVFFSPGFLNYLQWSPEEAYSSFKDLDPSCTVALFCCGLGEDDVMCYHKVPLTSYNSWPKFKAVRDEGQQSGFSPYMMQLIREVFPTENSITRNTIIVPELVNKEYSDVYVIFPNIIPDTEDISVHIESSSIIHVSPENVNPYVIKFKVPEMLLENCQTFAVQIYQSQVIIVEKVLRIIQDPETCKRLPRSDSKLKVTSKVIKLEEQLKLLSDIGGISLEDLEYDSLDGEYINTPSSEQEMTRSLIAMCSKYGLEELSMFIEEPPLPDEKCMAGLNRNSFAKQPCGSRNLEIIGNGMSNSTRVPTSRITCAAPTIPDNDGEGFYGITRSMSLPSILPPKEDFSGASGEYLPMDYTQGRSKLRAFPSSDAISVSESCISNNTYICMQPKNVSPDVLKASKKVLSKSQQELLQMMLAYKKGEKTISDVEKEFQFWQQKHCPHSKLTDSEPEEMSKYPLPFCSGWRRPARKASNASDSVKRCSGSSVQSRLSSLENNRKSSNASASSSSSKTSDASILITQAQLSSTSSKSPHEVSTGWIPRYSTARVCPLSPEVNPPPPPPARPRTICRSRTELDRMSKSRASAKRKAGTHLTPIWNEIYDSRSTDSEDGHKEETLESLLNVCQKYGLEDLGEFFFSEILMDKDAKNLGMLKDDNLPIDEIQNMVDECILQLPSGEWDPDKTLSFRRSLSLPSTLFPTEPKESDENTEKNLEDRGNREAMATSILKCEGYVNSIQGNRYTSTLTSNIYASILTSFKFQRGYNFVKDGLSNSQVELLKLMGQFKRGEKTISQVEEQFKEWQQRHMGSCLDRERQLSQLKDQYERAQKTNTFGIKSFLPKKLKKKTSKASDNGKSGKTSTGKSESESKRLSKLSYASTSSGVSDNGDVFKNVCYFNPEYGQTAQNGTRPLHKRSASSTSECRMPPPLPPRPPLAPLSVLKTCYPKGDIRDQIERTLLAKLETPSMATKPKPNPPPKPPNLFHKVSGCSELIVDNEEGKGDTETRSNSPIYIDPSTILSTPPKKNTIYHFAVGSLKSANTYPLQQCPVNLPHICAKGSANCTLTSNSETGRRKKELTTGSSVSSKQADNASQKRQIFFIPNPWVKPKKQEESMFYITRRWSSEPELSMSLSERISQPIYLELLDMNENKKRSIIESTSLKDIMEKQK